MLKLKKAEYLLHLKFKISNQSLIMYLAHNTHLSLLVTKYTGNKDQSFIVIENNKDVCVCLNMRQPKYSNHIL